MKMLVVAVAVLLVAACVAVATLGRRGQREGRAPINEWIKSKVSSG